RVSRTPGTRAHRLGNRGSPRARRAWPFPALMTSGSVSMASNVPVNPRSVLDPGGRVVVSVYSSGAIGRLVPQDVIGLVRYLREHAHASQPPPTAPTPHAQSPR